MIYILELAEFEILAAAKGMTSYYGFPPAEEYDSRQGSYAVHRMLQNGILKQEQDSLVIQQPITSYMDRIVRADRLLVIDRGQCQQPRQCIYYMEGSPENDAEACICMENSAVDKSRVFLSAMSVEELFCQMQDLGQMPVPHLKEELGELDFSGQWEKYLPDTLTEKLNQGLLADSEELVGETGVHVIVTLRNKEDGNMSKRMLLVDSPLEYGMLLQTAGGTEWKRYEPEHLMKIIRKWWRGEV